MLTKQRLLWVILVGFPVLGLVCVIAVLIIPFEGNIGNLVLGFAGIFFGAAIVEGLILLVQRR